MQDWKVELSNQEMWMKYTCTHLPNKVPTCPLRTWFNSAESGIVHNEGRLASDFHWSTKGLDWGSKELNNMGRHQNITLTKKHKHERSTFSSASALR